LDAFTGRRYRRELRDAARTQRVDLTRGVRLGRTVLAASETIFGIDISKYQDDSTIDSANYVILNIEDPGFARKARRADAQAKPWGPYCWIYPTDNAYARALFTASKARAVGVGEPPLGCWADYEDNGVYHAQLVSWFQALDATGMRGGYYTNDWRVDHAALIRDVGTRWYWVAGYPGGNDGSWPGWNQLRTSRPAQLWQYSSSNGSLDRNVVVDLSWWQDSILSDQQGGFLMALSDEQQQYLYDSVHFLMEGGFGLPKLLPAVADIHASVAAAPAVGIEPVAAAVSRIVHDLAGIPNAGLAGVDKPTLRALLEAAAGVAVPPLPEPGEHVSETQRAELSAAAQAIRDHAADLSERATQIEQAIG
jgi:GH25 family lysozyme M1 (1,4-beta-N-acetylmuramidase)